MARRAATAGSALRDQDALAAEYAPTPPLAGVQATASRSASPYAGWGGRAPYSAYSPGQGYAGYIWGSSSLHTSPYGAGAGYGAGYRTSSPAAALANGADAAAGNGAGNEAGNGAGNAAGFGPYARTASPYAGGARGSSSVASPYTSSAPTPRGTWGPSYAQQRTAEDLEEGNDARIEGLSARVKLLRDITSGIGTEVREGNTDLSSLVRTCFLLLDARVCKPSSLSLGGACKFHTLRCTRVRTRCLLDLTVGRGVCNAALCACELAQPMGETIRSRVDEVWSHLTPQSYDARLPLRSYSGSPCLLSSRSAIVRFFSFLDCLDGLRALMPDRNILRGNSLAFHQLWAHDAHGQKTKGMVVQHDDLLGSRYLDFCTWARSFSLQTQTQTQIQIQIQIYTGASRLVC